MDRMKGCLKTNSETKQMIDLKDLAVGKKMGLQ